ncbi:hypothetical protein [Raoultella terrigena]|jgi:hypothetical protein|uniref:hypothetical protein n=1 Tax=Raoultella terrigena TaxID=577 RepID=UPI001F313C70|nr:hypothetical protein [Raoultella terrigena]MCE9901898.1 hypothetical protein [Raoultella terrigena]
MDRRTFISSAIVTTCFAKVSLADNKEVNNANLQTGIDFQGEKDSTDELQKIFDYASSLATKVPNGMQKVLINLNGIVRVSKQLVIDASKVNIVGPLTIIFSKDGNYKNYGVLLKSHGEGNVSYTNGVGSLFESVNFFSERKINLFFASNTNTPGCNPSCLINISQCRFTGFAKVFSNGIGGWGWNWDRCGFNECDYLLYLLKKKDSYERFSFSACIWQNGGTAFYVDNSLGQIYWQSGSFDYCQSVAYIVNGHVSINGHLEFSDRDSPIVTILGENSSFLFDGGCIFIGKNKGKYNLFEQKKHNQVVLNNIKLLTDGVNNDYVSFSNMDVSASNIIYTSEPAREIISKSFPKS